MVQGVSPLRSGNAGSITGSPVTKLGRNIVSLRVAASGPTGIQGRPSCAADIAAGKTTFVPSLTRQGSIGNIVSRPRFSDCRLPVRSTGSLVPAELPSPGRVCRTLPDGSLVPQECVRPASSSGSAPLNTLRVDDPFRPATAGSTERQAPADVGIAKGDKQLGGYTSGTASTTRPKTRRTTNMAVPTAPSEVPQPVEEEPPCGLTQASLKHLKRRVESLLEERERLLAEISRLRLSLKEQERLASSKTEGREAALWQEIQDTRALYEAECTRALELQGRLEPLEEASDRLEQEVAQLRQALADERLSSRSAVEDERRKAAADREEAARVAESRTQQRYEGMDERLAELEECVDRLRRDKKELRELREEHKDLTKKLEDWKQKARDAKADVEKLSRNRAEQQQQLEKEMNKRLDQLRIALVADVIQSKLELHLCLPQVVLTYNDAPPLLISMANGLSKDRMREFVNSQVFPHFQPLWVCLDSVDVAPDGTNEKQYSTKILELLTEAVKDFVDRSQKGDEIGAIRVPGLLSWHKA